MKNPGWSVTFFISSLLSGLQDEINAVVKMHKPFSLQEAFETDRGQEIALEAFSKKSKSSFKNSIHQPSSGVLFFSGNKGESSSKQSVGSFSNSAFKKMKTTWSR